MIACRNPDQEITVSRVNAIKRQKRQKRSNFTRSIEQSHMAPASTPETSAAAKWLTSHCTTSEGPRLAAAIEFVLNERYTGHWCAAIPLHSPATRARIKMRARAHLRPPTPPCLLTV